MSSKMLCLCVKRKRRCIQMVKSCRYIRGTVSLARTCTPPTHTHTQPHCINNRWTDKPSPSINASYSSSVFLLLPLFPLHYPLIPWWWFSAHIHSLNVFPQSSTIWAGEPPFQLFYRQIQDRLIIHFHKKQVSKYWNLLVFLWTFWCCDSLQISFTHPLPCPDPNTHTHTHFSSTGATQILVIHWGSDRQPNFCQPSQTPPVQSQSEATVLLCPLCLFAI